MSSIDNRIVNMQFNNKGFESGISTTLKSLQKLDESLKMKNATSGLSDIDSSVKKINMGVLGSAVETVSNKFSALGVIGVTALVNITNSAVNAGKNIVKALTIDPITSGFSEYETKMGSIQTILTNTAHAGTTLADVTKALNELNTYADKTIYNFAEMTKNIGTFTAAGIDLDTSTAAIKGIANLAAASGSTSQQASTAMYQLSQALAAGKVSLMDWNSVVNAGMGGKLFQDALIRTSEVLGTGAEDMIKKYGSFRESLTQGEWLTSEVLTETLKQLSGAYTEADLIAQGFNKSQAKQIVELAKNASAAATEVKTVTQLFDTMKESVQSGWATSWEYIIGDKDEATELLTGISKAFEQIIGPSTEARNKMLEFWNEAGGRADVITGFENIFKSLGKGLGAIGDAWKEVFPSMTGEKLVELSEKFKNLTEKIKMSDETSKKIKDTFKGLFSVVDFLKNVFVNLFNALSPGVGVFAGLGNIALTVTSSIGNFFSKINEGAKSSKIFEKLSDAIKNSLESIGSFAQSAGDMVKKFFDALAGLNFQPIFDFISSVGSGLGSGLSGIFSGLGEAIGTINFDIIFAALGALAGKDAFKHIKDSISDFTSSLKDITSVGGKIKSVFDSVRETLEAFQNNLNAGTLLKIASAIGILAASLVVLSTIDAPKLENALSGITVLFIELIAGMGALLKLATPANLQGFWTISSALVALSSGILILSAAVKNMSDLNWNELAVGLTGVAGAMAILVAASKTLETGSKGMISTASGLVIFAAAINVLEDAVRDFGAMDPMSLMQGLLGVGAILAELALFMNMTDFSKLGLKSSAGILLVSSAIVVLSDAVEAFGGMNTGALIQGLMGVGAVLLEVAAFIALTGNASGVLSTAAGLVVLAAAMNVMDDAVKSFGSMSWEEIGRGLTAMAGALVVVGAAVALIPGSSLTATGAGLAVMSASLLLLGESLKNMGSMSWEEIGKSLVTLSGAMVIFAAAMAGMTGGLAGSSAMLVMAAAIAVLTPEIMALGKLKLSEIGTALVALAGTFTVLGVTSVVLGPLSPVLLAIASAVALLGAGCAAAGVGVAAFATGMAALAGVGAAGGLALAEILRQLIDLIPNFAKKMGEGLVEFAKVIGTSMPQLVTAMTQMITGMLEAISGAIPKIVEVGLELVIALCDVLLQALPRLIDVGVKLIVGLVEGLAKNVGVLVSAAVDLVVEFIGAIGSKIGDVIQAGVDLVIALIDGLANGIRDNAPRVKDAIINLCDAIIDAAKELLGIHSPSTVFNEIGCNVVEGLIQGIGKMIGDAVSKIGELISECWNKAVDAVSDFIEAGAEWISGVAKGIGQKVGEVGSKIFDMTKDGYTKVKDGVSNFVTGGVEWISGVAKGIGQKVGEVGSKIFDMTKDGYTKVKNGVGEFLSGGKDWIQNVSNGIGQKVGEVVTKVFNMTKDGYTKVKNGVGEFLSGGKEWISSVSSGIGQKVGDVSSKITSMTTTAYNNVKNKASSFLSAGKEWISNVASGISSSVSNVTSKVTSMATSAYNNVKNKASSFLSAGKSWISNMASGIGSLASSISSKVSSIASNAVSAAKNYVSSFTSIGKNMITGLKNGITSAASSIASTVKSVVNNAVTAAKKALGINSPSRVFMEIGKFTSMGMSKGLDDNADMVVGSSEELAKTAINSVSNTLSKIGDVLSSDIDVNPVISPVVDLNNVEKGARTIGELLSSSSTMSLTADASGRIAGSMKSIQNGNKYGNDEVVSAIKDLKKEISGMSSSTYQINGITYDDGSNVVNAVETLVRAAKIERRI